MLERLRDAGSLLVETWVVRASTDEPLELDDELDFESERVLPAMLSIQFLQGDDAERELGD
jgi:hypothetical protein